MGQDTLTENKINKINTLYNDRHKLYDTYTKDITRIETDHKNNKITRETKNELIKYKTEIYRYKTSEIDKKISILRNIPLTEIREEEEKWEN